MLTVCVGPPVGKIQCLITNLLKVVYGGVFLSFSVRSYYKHFAGEKKKHRRHCTVVAGCCL